MGEEVVCLYQLSEDLLHSLLPLKESQNKGHKITTVKHIITPTLDHSRQES